MKRPAVVPTPELFEEWAEFQRENPDAPPRLEASRLNPELASPFFGGDLMDFAIGQGAFTATPLQAAVSYAALVNGGVVKEPRVVDRVVDPERDSDPRHRIADSQRGRHQRGNPAEPVA